MWLTSPKHVEIWNEGRLWQCSVTELEHLVGNGMTAAWHRTMRGNWNLSTETWNLSVPIYNIWMLPEVKKESFVINRPARAGLSFSIQKGSRNLNAALTQFIYLNLIQARSIKTMSTNSSDNSRQNAEDLVLLVHYIKNDLYPKVKFIYNPEVDLAVTGKIYNDFKTNCKGRIGGRCITEPNRETYMETIWTIAANKHLQKNALFQKRSAVYTVMQNKFLGR